jgi:hypothetical protein
MEWIAVVLALAASVGASQGAKRPHAVPLGESFVLHAGESAKVEGEKLDITFDAVASDSRCPKGAQCIVEGDAVVRITAGKGSARTTHDLHTSERAAQDAVVDGVAIVLVRLDPYPVEGRKIEPRDYEATLQVTRGSSGRSSDPAAARQP